MKRTDEKRAYRPVRCSRELDETLGRLAAQRHTSKSEVLRDLVDRGLVSIGAKADDDYLNELVRRAVKETMQPQVERLAAISAKAAHISSAAFFMSVFEAMEGSSPAEQRRIEEAAGSARELGIQYLKLKDRDIDAFIQNGVKTMMEEDSNE
ncbi:ribbon-helix-helix protein, CopG family [Oscillibacter sp.]|uniref:ribbon-helix-helix protein, CopG family n=1 Tax=Oscillibacter sp. TaxID=1945593 RepID=UPI0028A0F596|nr:ribbon-helix-helix protein, CopG family [Oscillibacter sp.]